MIDVEARADVFDGGDVRHRDAHRDVSFEAVLKAQRLVPRLQGGVDEDELEAQLHLDRGGDAVTEEVSVAVLEAAAEALTGGEAGGEIEVLRLSFGDGHHHVLDPRGEVGVGDADVDAGEDAELEEPPLTGAHQRRTEELVGLEHDPIPDQGVAGVDRAANDHPSDAHFEGLDDGDVDLGAGLVCGVEDRRVDAHEEEAVLLVEVDDAQPRLLERQRRERLASGEVRRDEDFVGRERLVAVDVHLEERRPRALDHGDLDPGDAAVGPRHLQGADRGREIAVEGVELGDVLDRRLVGRLVEDGVRVRVQGRRGRAASRPAPPERGVDDRTIDGLERLGPRQVVVEVAV